MDAADAGWRKKDLPFLIGDRLGIGVDDAADWISDGDTVEVAWHQDVGSACGVPYRPTKHRHMREMLTAFEIEWDEDRHSSASSPSEGGGNLKREAYLDLYLAMVDTSGPAYAGTTDSWTMHAIRARRGQAQFREALLSAYGSQCAVTGSRALPVLEAAHILPFAEGGLPVPTNGLLLRSDIHTLFDFGLLRIRPDLTIEIDESLDRSEYEAFDGRRLRAPDSIKSQPTPGLLEKRYKISRTMGAGRRPVAEP